MRKIRREQVRGTIGMICIVLAVAGFIGWEQYGRVAFTYKPVLVFKETIQKGTIVEKNMLGVMMAEKDQLIHGVITDPQEIIGKRANTYIPQGLQLCGQFFSDPQLVTGNGSYICSLPMNWIYSFPQTLRRGDTIYFYGIDQEAIENMDAIEAEVPLGEKPLISVKIAYVKDGSNREVIDVTPDRMDGTSTVSQIEVVITEEKYQTIKTAAEKNQKFILMYE